MKLSVIQAKQAFKLRAYVSKKNNVAILFKRLLVFRIESCEIMHQRDSISAFCYETKRIFSDNVSQCNMNLSL